MLADIAQLVRASGCGSEGRGFETPCSPAIPYYHFHNPYNSST